MAVLKIENVSKQYRLGQVGTGTLSHDLKRWWYLARGNEDPFAKVGAENDRSVAGGDYVWALKDINFEVQQGEVLGIIGKNGAGKSTLLKLLSQVTQPTTGNIKVKGRIASLLEVGTGFHPELTGRENIFLNGAILGMTRAEVRRKLDEIVEFAGVAKFLDTPTKRYSSGMTVRLGFAIAAHLEPEILVVDEVLAVGDAEFQKKAIGKMKDVSQSDGRTVLFVSHNMGSIKSLCSRTIMMKNGKLFLEGETNSIVNEYLKEGVDHRSFGTIPKELPRNSYYKGFADISTITPKSINDDLREVFKLGEPMVFEISFQIKQKIDKATFIFSFMDEEFHRISYSSSHKKVPIEGYEFEKGNYLVKFKIDQQLLPGLYQIGFSLMNQDGYSYDSIQYFGEIKIEDYGESFSYPWQKRLAPVYFDSEFEIIINE